jgi:hypothetical protein
MSLYSPDISKIISDLEITLAFSHHLLFHQIYCETYIYAFLNSIPHMTQEDLVCQLHEEGMSAVAIHMRLVGVFGSLAI